MHFFAIKKFNSNPMFLKSINLICLIVVLQYHSNIKA